MSYTRAEDVQIDNWELVGNKGWSWKSLFPYYKKSEGFQMPTADQIAHGASYDANYHGMKGPLKVGWPTGMTNTSVFPVLNKTFEKLGVHYNRDSEGGQMVGFTVHPDTVDRENNVREDAARAYYWPYKARPNLRAISNTTPTRLSGQTPRMAMLLPSELRSPVLMECRKSMLPRRSYCRLER